MPKTEALITIQNVVATGTLNQKVDLNAIVKGYPGVEYRPEQFPGLVFRLKNALRGGFLFTVQSSIQNNPCSQQKRFCKDFLSQNFLTSIFGS